MCVKSALGACVSLVQVNHGRPVPLLDEVSLHSEALSGGFDASQSVLHGKAGVYTVTDPPVKLVRRIIPPIAIGGARVDVGFMVLVLVLSLLLRFTR